MRNASKHDERMAQDFVDRRNDGNKMGKNIKQYDGGPNVQARLGATLRVIFNPITKAILDVFHKDNHTSHR